MITNARWPFAGFYACYFAVIGVWLPYWPLYLDHLGYGAQTIGLLTALMQWSKVPAPPLWGRLADRGSRHQVIIVTTFAAFVTFSLFFFGTGTTWMIGATILFSIFHAGPLSLTDATAIELCVQEQWEYGKLRLWGSWGFILCSLGVGSLTDWVGVSIVPMIIFALLLGSGFFTLWLPRTTQTKWSEEAKSSLFARHDVRWFYGSVFLMHLSHGAYYGFISIHLQHHGFSRTLIGFLWAVGVVAEVILLTYAKPLLARFGITRILTFSILMAACRWLFYATTLQIPLLIIGQLLHAFTFGAFHIASVHRVYDFAPIHLRAAAQGWLSALSFGAGGGIGIALSGLLFNRIGGQSLFLIMTIIALIGVLVSYKAETLLKHYEHIHV